MAPWKTRDQVVSGCTDDDGQESTVKRSRYQPVLFGLKMNVAADGRRSEETEF
jgi:hypothetical protein